MSDLLTSAEVESLAREAGLTMNEVCRRAGVARSIFTRWKGGETTPSLENYQRMVRAVRTGKSVPAADPKEPTKPKRRTAANTTSSVEEAA
jgi:transcriptional regulator with XRE-family HTH domain